MDLAPFLAAFPPAILAAAAAVMAAGGFMKGVTGFALPLVVVSGLGMVMSPQQAVALLIVPTFASNLWQMLRQGRGAAWQTLGQVRWLALSMILAIALTAQALPRIPPGPLFLLLGVVITGLALIQLSGWRPRLRQGGGTGLLPQLGIGTLAGTLGGVSGIWGPPVVLYLLAIGAEKTYAVRAQGLLFFAGSVAITLAHLKSGLLDEVTGPISLAMTLPVLAGMALGLAVQDRLDQARFRRIALVVLVVAGLNLIRRGLV